MDKDTEKFLYELLNTPSPTGFEVKGQRVWANRCREFAESVDSDSYGNAWATINGSEGAPTVMIEAHADEIGFMVKYINDDGYLRVDRDQTGPLHEAAVCVCMVTKGKSSASLATLLSISGIAKTGKRRPRSTNSMSISGRKTPTMSKRWVSGWDIPESTQTARFLSARTALLAVLSITALAALSFPK